MKRSALTPVPNYFDRYINKVGDVEILEAIAISAREIDLLPVDQWKKLGDYAYAPGKWTIGEIVQHMIDTERIFCYRALAMSRGEKNALPSFDEVGYGELMDAKRRSLDSLIAEFKLVRQATKMLFESFTPEMLLRTGKGFSDTCSVAAIGFIIPGHQRWHLDVIKERYLK